MSEANDITARLLIDIPKRFPGARVWRQNTGGGIGMSTVKQAVALLQCNRISDAITLLLSRPIKWGIKGCGDITGIFQVARWVVIERGTRLNGVSGLRLEIEVKADKDQQSDEQKAFGVMIANNGGIHIVARSVEQCLEDLGRWA